MALGALMFAGLVVFFYSGGFMDMKGLKGLYETFRAWAHTGQTGNGHEKAWYYWLQLFGRYEWPACIGVLAALTCVLPGTPRFIRALAINGCGTLAAYSIIHYKTPWCIVSLTWPFLFLFGYGLDFVLRKCEPPDGSRAPRLIVGAVAGCLLVANASYMVWLNFFHYTDAKQPYVYVQTFNEVNRLMDPLDKLVALDPANQYLTGQIVMDSYHPLPWLLGDFPNIGYYDDDSTPKKMDADFLLVEETRIDDVEAGLHDAYFTEPLKLRDAEDEATLYLSVKKFQSVFPGRKPDFEPGKEAPADDAAGQSPASTPVPTAQASQ
jgi:hypothetical protein